MSVRARDRNVAWALVVVAVVPIVVAAARALLHHWLPVGDDGLIAVRAGDVFGSATPLIGQAASVSIHAPRPLNHPGPLLFELLAAPIAVLGRAAGTAVGVAVVNGASIAIAAWVGWRHGGLRRSALASLVGAALAWSMGSALLYDPWQPHVLLLPFLAFLFLVWGTAEGDLVLAIPAVAIGSLLVQTHLTYGYLVPLLLIGATGLGLVRRRGHTARDGRSPARPLVVAVGVGAVLWIPPVVEQLTTRRGNLGRILDLVRASPDAIVGWHGAVRITGGVLARPPFWLRDSFADAIRPKGQPVGANAVSVATAGVPSFRWSAIAMGVLLLALTALAVWSWRRRRTAVLTGVGVAMAAIAIGLFTASRVGTDIVGVAPHQFRFLWPIGAFTTFVVLDGVLEPTARRAGPRRFVIATISALVVVASVANLPTAAATGGPQLDGWSVPVMRDLDRQLGRLRTAAPLLVEWSDLRFQEPISGAIMAELASRGIRFVTASPYEIRHLGPERRYDGHNARSKVFYRSGTVARQRRLGPFRRIAFHDGLDRVARGRLRALERQIDAYLATTGLSGSSRLQAAIDSGYLGTLRGPFDTPAARRAALASGQLATASEGGFLDLAPPWTGRFSEYARLHEQAERDTIGVYVGPVHATAP